MPQGITGISEYIRDTMVIRRAKIEWRILANEIKGNSHITGLCRSWKGLTLLYISKKIKEFFFSSKRYGKRIGGCCVEN